MNTRGVRWNDEDSAGREGLVRARTRPRESPAFFGTARTRRASSCPLKASPWRRRGGTQRYYRMIAHVTVPQHVKRTKTLPLAYTLPLKI